MVARMAPRRHANWLEGALMLGLDLFLVEIPSIPSSYLISHPPPLKEGEGGEIAAPCVLALAYAAASFVIARLGVQDGMLGRFDHRVRYERNPCFVCRPPPSSSTFSLPIRGIPRMLRLLSDPRHYGELRHLHNLRWGWTDCAARMILSSTATRDYVLHF